MTNNRIASLDYLRLIAASAVMFSHSFILSGAPDHDWLERQSGSIDFAAVGVDFFFFLSGFLMFGALKRSSDRGRFIVNRLARILPGLTVCVVMCILLGAVMTSLSVRQYFTSAQTWLFAKNAMFLFTPTLPGVFLGNPYPSVVNGSLWTLFYEILCYWVTVVISTWTSRRRGATFFLISVACLIALALRTAEGPTLGGNAARLMFFFALGHVFANGPTGQRIVLAVLLVGVVTAVVMPQDFTSRIQWHLTSAVCCVAVLGCAMRIDQWIRPMPSDYSFGVYIYGFPVQQWLAEWQWGWSPEVFFISSMLLVLPFAAFSWHWVERPAMKAIQRLQVARRENCDVRSA